MKSLRLQFSLRLLLLAMLVLGLALGWLANRAQHNREQRRLVERLWRIGGAVYIDGSKFYELPVFADEWQIEANKGWLYDARVTCRPLDIIFPNHTGIKEKTSDADLDELIDVVRQLPTVRQIYLSRMFHSEEGAMKVKRSLPHIRVQLDQTWIPKQAAEPAKTSL